MEGASTCNLKLGEHSILDKKKVKFGTATHCGEEILYYVHIDAWRHDNTESIGDNQYFMSFIDDYSKRCWVYTIKH